MAQKLDIKDEIAFPRAEVFATYRDHLPDLAAYLPNIESISVESREEHDDGRVELVNLWKAARSEVPAVARPFVKPEMLQWHDYATWDPNTWECSWRTELGFLPEAIKSSGKNFYTEKGDDRMQIHLTGTIEVDGRKIPGVPRFMSRRVAKAVEGFVRKLTEPNLREINRGLERYMEAQSEAESD